MTRYGRCQLLLALLALVCVSLPVAAQDPSAQPTSSPPAAQPDQPPATSASAPQPSASPPATQPDQPPGADPGQPAPAPPAGSPPTGPDKAPSSSEAQTKKTCLASFRESQRARKRSQLLASRAELLVCGQATCPAVIRVQCVKWMAEVRAAVPTIVVAATDSNGKDLVDIRVALDGKAISSPQGTPIELDPGAHQLKVEHDGQTLEQRIVAVQGRKNHVVTVRFETETGPTGPVEKSFRMPVPSWIGFGVGAASMLVGALTGGIAIVKGDELQDACENDICHPPQKQALDSGTALAHTSTVFLSVGGGALVFGVISLFVFDTDDSADADAEDKPETQGVQLAPLLGPGFLGLRGTF